MPDVISGISVGIMHLPQGKNIDLSVFELTTYYIANSVFVCICKWVYLYSVEWSSVGCLGK